MNKLLTLNALYFMLIAIAGVVGHVVNKWLDNEIKVSVYSWFVDNPKSTVAMILGVFGSLVVAIANGQITDVNDTNQVMIAFLWGYAGNSILNKQGGAKNDS